MIGLIGKLCGSCLECMVWGIKGIYIDSLVCVRIKGGKSEQFSIDSGVRQWCIMSPSIFNVYMDAG